MQISKTRERIKNLLLFHSGKFDSKNPEDVQLAEKLAANATICLSEQMEQKEVTFTQLQEDLKTDAEWWQPDLDVVSKL